MAEEKQEQAGATGDAAQVAPQADQRADELTAALPAYDPDAHASRRRFLAGLAAATGAAVFGGDRAIAKQDGKLPHPDNSDIEHIVVVMMENRSFDHYLGWVPGADGRQAGLSYLDRTGTRRATYPLAPDFQGCAHPDPDHSYEGGRGEYNHGACDGWLQAGQN